MNGYLMKLHLESLSMPPWLLASLLDVSEEVILRMLDEGPSRAVAWLLKEASCGRVKLCPPPPIDWQGSREALSRLGIGLTRFAHIVGLNERAFRRDIAQGSESGVVQFILRKALAGEISLLEKKAV